MIKPSKYFYFVLFIVLSGCAPVSASPTASLPIEPSNTIPTVTFQPTQWPTSTSTATLTPPATMEPDQAKDAIKTLMQDSADCDAPCFWGIVPGKTNLGEAINIFTKFGLQWKSKSIQGKDFYGIVHEFDSGMGIDVILTVQNELVENLRLEINPEKQKAGIPREWSAYSPETLITRYGLPSKVDFFIGTGPGPALFVMDVYFSSRDLIVEYESPDVYYADDKFQACLLTAQIDFVRVWMGKDPQYPPTPGGVPLDEATSLTMDDFSKLMTGTPSKACLNLKGEAFPD